MTETIAINKRFRGFLPIVIDVETAGLNAATDALLEIAAIQTHPHEATQPWAPHAEAHWHVRPFEGSQIKQASLDIHGIDPHHPLRLDVPESTMLEQLFEWTNEALKQSRCKRAILVGHNAHFDLQFLLAACQRCQKQNIPFHGFTCLDTATLAGLCYGETVLAKALAKAKIPFDKTQAHSALYDAKVTATLFCQMVNQSSMLG